MTVSAVSLAVKALLADSNITALVSTRVYPDPIDIQTARPCISVSLVAEDEERLLSGSSQYPLSMVHISCHGTTATSVLNVGEAVKTALRDLRYTTGGKSGDFKKTGPDFTDWSEDGRSHRRLIGYEIRWR